MRPCTSGWSMRSGTPRATEVAVPTRTTLRKYGLTEETWRAILDRQGGTCGACGRIPRSGRLNVDHEHVRGWPKMPPEQRVQYVRGLLDHLCNSRRLSRGATVENLRGAAAYLERYQNR